MKTGISADGMTRAILAGRVAPGWLKRRVGTWSTAPFSPEEIMTIKVLEPHPKQRRNYICLLRKKYKGNSLGIKVLMKRSRYGYITTVLKEVDRMFRYKEEQDAWDSEQRATNERMRGEFAPWGKSIVETLKEGMS